MVQAYHAVPVSVEYEDSDNSRPTDHEGSALLGSRASGAGVAKSEVQNEGHATLTSSVGNLANTIIGSGAFALFPSFIVVSYSLPCMVPKECSPFLGYVPLVSEYILLVFDPVCNVVGPRVFRNHPWHVDLRLLWCS
jgi:hypothetical protein